MEINQQQHPRDDPKTMKVTTTTPRVQVEPISHLTPESPLHPPSPSTPQKEIPSTAPPIARITSVDQKLKQPAVQQQQREKKKQKVEDWISTLIESLWPNITAVMEKIAFEQVPQVLDENRPSWIHSLSLSKFSMGVKEPDISDIKCFKDNLQTTIDDAIYIEFDLFWKSSDQDVEIKLEILGKDASSIIPNILENQVAKLLTMKVGVENICIKGTLQVALSHIINDIPIVGAVRCSFTETPSFDFTPTITGGLFGSMLSGLLVPIHAWLKKTVQEAIFMPYVIPEHVFLPLQPDLPDLMPPIGYLQTRIIEAKNIPKMDWFSWSDTFVDVFVRASQHNTTSIKTGKSPRWNEVMTMPIHSVSHQIVRYVLWDWDALSPNDEIGRCEIAVADLLDGDGDGDGEGQGESEGGERGVRVRDIWLPVHGVVTDHAHNDENDGDSDENGDENENGNGCGERMGREMERSKRNEEKKEEESCQLHVRIALYHWSREERLLIQKAKKVGIRKFLLFSNEGMNVNQELKYLMAGGSLDIRIHQCSGLHVHRVLFRPSVYAVVKVANLHSKSTAAYRVSKWHGNADLSGSPLQMNIPGEIVLREDVGSLNVVIELKEHGFFFGTNPQSLGKIRILLQDLIDRGGHLHDTYEVQKHRHHHRHGTPGGNVPTCAVELQWTPTF